MTATEPTFEPRGAETWRDPKLLKTDISTMAMMTQRIRFFAMSFNAVTSSQRNRLPLAGELAATLRSLTGCYYTS